MFFGLCIVLHLYAHVFLNGGVFWPLLVLCVFAKYFSQMQHIVVVVVVKPMKMFS